MPKIDINGVQLYYITIGNGSHSILCMPGFLGTAEDTFGDIFKTVDQQRFRLVAWDPPGYGKSRPPNREIKMGYLKRDAELAAELMKKLGYERYSVLGVSQGGDSGLILASAFPSNVISLATLAVAAKYDEHMRKVGRFYTMVDHYPEKKLNELLKVYDRDYLKKMTTDLLSYGMATGHDNLRDVIGPIKCPLLITHGQKDSVCQVYQARELMMRFPLAKLHIFPDGNHDLHSTHPEEFAGVVFQFFNSTFESSGYSKYFQDLTGHHVSLPPPPQSPRQTSTQKTSTIRCKLQTTHQKGLPSCSSIFSRDPFGLSGPSCRGPRHTDALRPTTWPTAECHPEPITRINCHLQRNTVGFFFRHD
ncbi:unnamed protein product [Allacma fusca]|uniref:AB hydrolase-1 domain-containing protein n=1 Tax=Allacma fusca TaxID=39272 RepID=A0A8J2P6P9_9HEXA|nr:unnamed protein product [Allacma fusca]